MLLFTYKECKLILLFCCLFVFFWSAGTDDFFKGGILFRFPSDEVLGEFCNDRYWLIFHVSLWIQIPFAEALDLFRGRKVYLENGFAYVPHKDIVAIILNEFRTKLSKALAVSI